MTPIECLDAFERVAIVLRKLPPSEDVAWFLAAASEYMNGDEPIGLCLGLDAARQGTRDPRTLRRLAAGTMTRAEANRRAFALIDAPTENARVEQLRAKIAAYFASTACAMDLRRDKNPHAKNSLKAAIWDALKAWPAVPSAATIRRDLQGR